MRRSAPEVEPLLDAGSWPPNETTVPVMRAVLVDPCSFREGRRMRTDPRHRRNVSRSRAGHQSFSIEGAVSLVAKVSTAMFCGRGPVASNRAGFTPCSIARRTLCPRADAAR